MKNVILAGFFVVTLGLTVAATGCASSGGGGYGGSDGHAGHIH